jgi:FkbM family methyltransferase
MMVFHCVFCAGEYWFGLPSEPPHVIIDAGANIGMSAIFYARRFPQARIIAIEAEQSNYALMCSNIRRYANILPVHGALWGADGSISIGTDMLPGASGHWGYTVSPEAGPIRAYTIPSLMRTFQLDHIDLLKIDIEGAEQEVFETCDWQDHVDSFIIELHDRFRPGCAAPVARALEGFKNSTSGDLSWFHR